MQNNHAAPLISIIVPIFNSALFVERCVNSLLFQSYSNLEIILLDGGSIDGSLHIIERLAAADSRIQLITQSGSIAKARNIGLSLAKGEFITFVDSDDFVDSDYVFSLYRALIENDTAFSACDYSSDLYDFGLGDKDRARIVTLSPNAFCDLQNISRDLFFVVVWGKLFRAALFKKICFDETRTYGEDYDFLLRLYSGHTVTYSRIDAKLYYYDKVRNSASRDALLAINSLERDYSRLEHVKGRHVQKELAQYIFNKGWTAFRRTPKKTHNGTQRKLFSHFLKSHFSQLNFISKVKAILFLLKLDCLHNEQRTITHVMVGNLGNQLFQYAFLYSMLRTYSLDKIYIYFIDSFGDCLASFNANYGVISSYLSIKANMVAKIKFVRLLKKIGKLALYTEAETEAFIQPIACKQAKKGILLAHREFVDFEVKGPPFISHGYFEDPRYFEPYREDLKILFTPKKPVLSKNLPFISLIRETNSFCVSIRRGDFLDAKLSNLNVCDVKYFSNAIQVIKQRVEKPVFFFFSDDISWCKNNVFHMLNDHDNFYFESGDDAGYEKLRLMYSCKHFVISNSTFSWWAQYLSRNEAKIVVAPKSWRKNEDDFLLCNPDWVLM